MPIREEPSQSDGSQIFGYFNDLLDVNLSGLLDQSYIKYDAASLSWLPVTGIGSSITLDGLSDVNTGGAASGQTLIYNGTSWVVGYPTGVGATVLDGLNDVVLGTPAVHKALVYNGSNWIDSGILLNSLFDVDTTDATASGRALIWNGSSWIVGHPTGAGAGVATLDDLTDTIITSAATHQILAYNGSNWVNSGVLLNSLFDVDTTDATASGRALVWNGSTWIVGHPTGSMHLDGLTDVVITSQAVHQSIVYNGTNWINSGVLLNSLFDVDTSDVTKSGQILLWNGSTWVAGNISSIATGYYDVTQHGISNTGVNVTVALRSLLNAIPSKAHIKFPPGTYLITGTIRLNQKVDWYVDAIGARFIENSYQIVSGHAYPMCSGMFYLNYCTGMTWVGGWVSGAATMNEIYSLSSGMICSGYGSDSYGNFANDGQGSRNVISTTFNLEQCSDIKLERWKIYNKYRFVYSYRGLDLFFRENHYYGVITGISLRNQLTTTIGPTGNEVQIGDIHKLAGRQTYKFTIVKGRNVIVSDGHTQNNGGTLTAGSASLGGGQGQAIAEQINVCNYSMKNAYDNHVYFSSAHRCSVNDSICWNDETLNHICDGMKGRGSYIIFNNCQVHNAHHGYGIEGVSNAEDHWTFGNSPGWSSQGCKIINCVAANIGTVGIFCDANEDDTVFPRDVVIEGNYLYNCQLGPYGRNPTGFIAGDDYANSVIAAADCYRVKVRNNIIEHTGSFASNQAIFVGRLRTTMWISGCVIEGNTFLGCKQGIRAVYLSDFRISDNYGERFGWNTAPYLEQSGASALIVTDNVRNGRIRDNTLAPTGHVFGIWTIPGSTFDNIRRSDNDGAEIIN